MKQIEDMTLAEMLTELNQELVKSCLTKVREDGLDRGDLGSIITLLKNNKVVQDKKEHSEADLIDELIDD